MSVRFGNGARTIADASVDIQGLVTGVANGQTVALPAGSSQIVLVVTRRATGPVIVPFVVVDACGEWPSFVGMGT